MTFVHEIKNLLVTWYMNINWCHITRHFFSFCDQANGNNDYATLSKILCEFVCWNTFQLRYQKIFWIFSRIKFYVEKLPSMRSEIAG